MECVFSVIIAAILGGAVVAILLGMKIISLQRTIDNLVQARILLQGEAHRISSAVDAEISKLEEQVKAL